VFKKAWLFADMDQELLEVHAIDGSIHKVLVTVPGRYEVEISFRMQAQHIGHWAIFFGPYHPHALPRWGVRKILCVDHDISSPESGRSICLLTLKDASILKCRVSPPAFNTLDAAYEDSRRILHGPVTTFRASACLANIDVLGASRRRHRFLAFCPRHAGEVRGSVYPTSAIMSAVPLPRALFQANCAQP
jgi:hypothetical protein